MKNSYQFFYNKDCEYFPCHKTDNPNDFNCMFCYCPLYLMGDLCGGHFDIIRGSNGVGIKDCSRCMIPHSPNGWSYIVKKLM